jgi:phosphotriesterase-related protein
MREMTGKFVQTVTGPLDIDSVTLADGHAHVWIDPAPEVTGAARIELNDYAAVRAELEDFRGAGGQLLVDCQPGTAGRDSRALQRLSRDTGVAITATTGTHQQMYYAPESWIWRATVDEAAAWFIDELTVGMHLPGEPPPADAYHPAPRAAVIKIGYEGVIEGQTAVLMEAAAQASAQTGASILFHTEQGRNVEALIPFYAALGVPATRLYMCHVDKRVDAGLHRELAQAGVLLGYDTFARPKYNPDQGAWKLIEALVGAGLDGSIAVCLDLAFPRTWRAYGGEPGLRFLPEVVVPRLVREGYSEQTIRRLTARNVLERLAWDKDSSSARA